MAHAHTYIDSIATGLKLMANIQIVYWEHVDHHYTNLTFVRLSVCDVRAGGHGKLFDLS